MYVITLAVACMCFGQALSLIVGETRQVHGWKPFSSGQWNERNVAERSACVNACVSNTSCVAVAHLGQTCIYFSRSTFPVKPSTDTNIDSTIIFVRGKFVLLASSTWGCHGAGCVYTYAYPEAKAACKSVGGRLTYRNELQQVYNDGYNYCVCGWLNDGNRMYPMQESQDECGSQVGLVWCNWANRATAWCTIDTS